MNRISLFVRTLFLTLTLALSVSAYGQSAQTQKQSLPLTAGTILHDKTVYVASAGSIIGDVSFPNALQVAEGATATIYIPKGVTLTVQGANAQGLTGAGAGILVPSTSTLYITGEGTLIAIGGNAANGGDGTNGANGTTSGKTAVSGKGGDGGYGGGGGAAAIGGSGGDGGAIAAGAKSLSARRGSEGENGLPDFPESSDCNGKDGNAGGTMGNVYILGSVIVQTTNGSNGTAGGNAGYHGTAISKSSNATIWAGGGGAGAGGGAGYGALYGIGGGGAGAGGGAAGGSGAADSGNKNTPNQNNIYGHASSASGYGEGAVNGAVNNNTTSTGVSTPRDGGAALNNGTEVFKRFGGYGGEIGGKAGARGGNGYTYVLDGSVDITGATIGNKISLSEVPSTLDVNIKLNNQNDEPADYITATIGEIMPSVQKPIRGGYEFMGYYTQPNGGGTQIYGPDGNAVDDKRCDYVQSDNPVLYAHWILMTYTITWNYKYYDGSQGMEVIVPDTERCKSANVVLRLNDGTTHQFLMSVAPAESQIEIDNTVVLRDVVSTDIFNKIVSVQSVEPVKPAGSESDVVQISLDYMTESSASIFYDPTRYMVKWSVNVNSDKKPEYLLINVKRGLSSTTSDASMDGEDPTRYSNLRIRLNADGTYDGSAILRYQDDNGSKYYYSLEVVGARDDSGHDIIFSTPIVSLGKTDGVMSCDKPVSGPTIPEPARISLALDLASLTFDPNDGILSDETPETLWDAPNTVVNIPTSYTASLANYTYYGWGYTRETKEDGVLTSVNIGSGKTVYAVLLDKTPPEIVFGTYTKETTGYQIPVTISDAISEDNIIYYALYDNNPGDPTIDDPIWEDASKTTKKILPHGHSSTESVKFNTTSVVYLHVKAVDASGNAAVASKEIKVDTKAPVVTAYPNMDVFCKTSVVVDMTDDVGITSYSVTNYSGAYTDIADGKTFTLPIPSSGSVDYTITVSDAAGNTTVRTITIWADHDFANGIDMPAKEPTESGEGNFRYKKCLHCNHIILLRGNPDEMIDITNEEQRGRWIIPSGAVLIMSYGSGVTDYPHYDVLDYKSYINEAITTANTTANASVVRITKNTALASSDASSPALVNPTSKPMIYLDLNGKKIVTASGNDWTKDITGQAKVTILLRDNGKLPYVNKSVVTSTSPILYTRELTAVQAGTWQSLYIPIPFVTPDQEEYTIAQYSSRLSRKDPAANGEVVMKVAYVDASTQMVAYHPLFIKAGDNGTAKTIAINAVSGTALPASSAWNTNTQNGDGDGFTFMGGVAGDAPLSGANGAPNYWVLLNNGTFWWAANGQQQRAYRWYVQPEEQLAHIRFAAMVDDEPTAIDEVECTSLSNELKIYTIDGRKINASAPLHRGIYIINGKKVFIK